MGTDALNRAVPRGAAAAVLAGLALMLPAAEALGRTAERRHGDGVCDRGTAQERRCTIRSTPSSSPLTLSLPKTCHTQNVLASAYARDPKTVRHVAVRLDGVTIETTSPERPFWIGTGIDCAALTVGDHIVTATLRRRDGTTVKLTRTLTRLAGPAPGILVAERKRIDGPCVRRPGTRARRCGPPAGSSGPLRLSVPKTCHTANVLAATSARHPKTVRHIALRLDGATIGTTTPQRPYSVGVGIDCAELALGDHVVSATLRRRDGSVVKVTRTLTRLAGPEPDDIR
ncbi:MAG: hypothetical protein M3340_05590 [Actinomycetota bacterium]|nr:hypothetical protein [Actinomycetota bacterium]